MDTLTGLLDGPRARGQPVETAELADHDRDARVAAGEVGQRRQVTGGGRREPVHHRLKAAERAKALPQPTLRAAKATLHSGARSRNVELARETPNVYLDLSTANVVFAARLAIQEVPDRTIFGSDAPMATRS
ncbi:hypothetical protein ACIRYZ_40060 [Kitasatospora sp. NPDC101155]|uniref:hypothetical protein n=1 Tax=Kitasatospora sp. NPDC101155 TaxID=3364097 RepID=UPI00381E4410